MALNLVAAVANNMNRAIQNEYWNTNIYNRKGLRMYEK